MICGRIGRIDFFFCIFEKCLKSDFFHFSIIFLHFLEACRNFLAAKKFQATLGIAKFGYLLASPKRIFLNLAARTAVETVKDTMEFSKIL